MVTCVKIIVWSIVAQGGTNIHFIFLNMVQKK